MADSPPLAASSPRQLLLRLIRDSRQNYIYYLPIALGLVLESVAGLGVTDGLRRLVDAVVQRSYSLLWDATALALGGFAVSSLVSLVTGYLRAWVDQMSAIARQTETIRHVHGVHYDFVTGQPSGDLITRLVGNAYSAQAGFNEAAISIVQHVANLAVTLAYLTYLNWQLAGGSLLMAAAGPVVLNLMSGKIRRLWAERWKEEGRLSALVQDAVQGAEVSRALRLRTWLLGRFDSQYAVFLRLVRRIQLWDQLLNQVGMTMLLSGLFFALGYGGWLAAQGAITVGAVAAFLVSFERLNWPIQRLLQIWPNLQGSLSAAQRVYELLDRPLAPGLSASAAPSSVAAPATASVTSARRQPLVGIEFDHVTFAYPGRDAPVLQELSLTIPGGKLTAIVGETGSGKTTLFRLLLRLFDPDRGRIWLVTAGEATGEVRRVCLDGLPLAFWRRQLGYVSQEPVLFAGTLEENIRLGDCTGESLSAGADERWQPVDPRLRRPEEGVSRLNERLQQAVELAHLEDVVRRLPQGLATSVGERGARLSGGERQRVALARAAYRDPAILLLDEATSSLDNVSERWVQQALARLSVGRTTVVIAHRLSTVVDADQIVVIDQGRVVEVGRHDELLAAGGRYAHMYAAGRLTTAAASVTEPGAEGGRLA